MFEVQQLFSFSFNLFIIFHLFAHLLYGENRVNPFVVSNTWSIFYSPISSFDSNATLNIYNYNKIYYYFDLPTVNSHNQVQNS